MDELEKIIIFILNRFNQYSEEWSSSDDYVSLNMKKCRVEDVYHNEKILMTVINYRNFMYKNSVKIMEGIQLSNVSSRVKLLNSIQYKIEKYEFKDEQGKIPLKKCLNDIVGIRYISDKKLDFETIKVFVEQNYPALKCLNASKGKYKAVHIYFGNDNNNKFQWELQVWNRKDEESNYYSHFLHKQEYTKWELEKSKEVKS